MISISAQKRDIFGRKNKKLRREGKIPAVLYGEGIKGSIPIQLDEKEFKKVFTEVGESTLVKLKLEDKEYQVLIHDLQRDPLEDKIIHVDFLKPSLKEKIEATVPLIFKGEAPAVKNLGGILIKEISEIEVEALPQNLPREIEVDISKLEKIYDTILVKDLKLPKGVKVLKKPEEVVVTVVSPEEEKEEVKEEVTITEKVGEKETKEEKEEEKKEKKE